jgi:hypothetical protein
MVDDTQALPLKMALVHLAVKLPAPKRLISVALIVGQAHFGGSVKCRGAGNLSVALVSASDSDGFPILLIGILRLRFFARCLTVR